MGVETFRSLFGRRSGPSEIGRLSLLVWAVLLPFCSAQAEDLFWVERPLWFGFFSFQGPVSKSELPRLIDFPLEKSPLGSIEETDSDWITPSGPSVHVADPVPIFERTKTCRDYWQFGLIQSRIGADHKTSPLMRIDRTCTALKLLQTAKHVEWLNDPVARSVPLDSSHLSSEILLLPFDEQAILPEAVQAIVKKQHPTIDGLNTLTRVIRVEPRDPVDNLAHLAVTWRDRSRQPVHIQISQIFAADIDGNGSNEYFVEILTQSETGNFAMCRHGVLAINSAHTEWFLRQPLSPEYRCG
ncbi:MAG: hypothetical protein U0136_02855 [Bdellovibrionota bacterium]